MAYFIFLDSKITADGDCTHEIKRHSLEEKLDSVLKSRDITLPTKICIVKAMVFSVVRYGWESWIIKKTEKWRIDAFELWCWGKLLRTAGSSNQSILKEINPEYSLEGLMLKLKLQYFGHLMWRANWLEKTLMLGNIESRKSESESEAVQSCPTLWHPMDYSLPRSSIHGIFQARVLEWVAISFSRESSWPRDWTRVSRVVGKCFTIWATGEVKKAGKGDDRRWDGWMAWLTQWTWIWAGSERWWRTGKPGVLQSMGLQRVGQDWATEQQPEAKHWLTGKDPDPGKDWGQEEKGATEDEMVGQHHWLNGHEFEQTLRDSGGQRSLACSSPWSWKELDMTEQQQQPHSNQIFFKLIN